MAPKKPTAAHAPSSPAHTRTSTLAGIPVSVYAPLELPHPLELFGRDFPLHISTHFTFNPDTLSRAVVDVSLDAGMRQHAPALHQLRRKLAYVLTGKHRPSRTTSRLIAKHYERFESPDQIRRWLQGSPTPAHPRSDWGAVLQGLGAHGDQPLRLLCECLAACDAHALHVRALALSGEPAKAEAYVAALFQPDIEVWVDLNPTLLPKLYVLVEVALKATAWLECRLPQPPGGPDTQVSCLDGLLRPGSRPMAHWLQEVLQASRCRNLAQLANKLQWRSKYRGRALTHDRLRKWASCQAVLMPHAAVYPTLAAVSNKRLAEVLHARFFAARLFTFLCAVLRAGTVGEQRRWDDVQQHLRSRYAHAYRLQVAQQVA